MAPLSIAGTALQSRTGIPYEIFPLVMVGPALAALVCFVAVPQWFPQNLRPVPGRLLHRSLAATALAGLAYVLLAIALLDGGPMQIPRGWPQPAGVVGVVAGLTFGSLLEEIGYRGVMYRALVTRMRPWTATVVNGAFFGAAHLQYFGAGAPAVLLFISSAILMDVVMVALWAGSWWQRLAVATLFHSLINITLSLNGDSMMSVSSFGAITISSAAAALLAMLLGRRCGLGDYEAAGRSVKTRLT